jgi:hypothetical protein
MPINDAEGRSSFCWKLGYQKALVPHAAVRIVAGQDDT